MPRFDRPSPEARERWEFLKNLPKRYVRGELLFVHASPRNPVAEYLRKIDVLLGMADKLNENFAQVDWLCFVGHTHRSGRHHAGPEVPGARTTWHGTFRAQPHQKAIINPGSVGQPRDRDSRASFVTAHRGGGGHLPPRRLRRAGRRRQDGAPCRRWTPRWPSGCGKGQ